MIEIDAVHKRYGAAVALDGVSLRVAEGEFVVLVGTSGSGKSTLLRLINRLIEPDAGRVLLRGQDVSAQAPEQLRRRIGYAIQSVGLFPHWTVAQNIAAVPTLLGWPRARIAARVDALLDLLHLPADDFRGRYPSALSGGQQQRVGVARALAAEPEVLLMDEPFGALDPVTRLALQDELARIHALSGQTIVLVTHDIDEALALADRIVLLQAGRIVQQGTPQQVLREPVNEFVREFLGREARGLRLLGLLRVAERMRAVQPGLRGEPVQVDANLRDALSALLSQDREALPVVDASGGLVGSLHAADLLPSAASTVLR